MISEFSACCIRPLLPIQVLGKGMGHRHRVDTEYVPKRAYCFTLKLSWGYSADWAAQSSVQRSRASGKQPLVPDANHHACYFDRSNPSKKSQRENSISIIISSLRKQGNRDSLRPNNVPKVTQLEWGRCRIGTTSNSKFMHVLSSLFCNSQHWYSPSIFI